MGVRVTKTHNKDGSITKRTTYTRKTIFGTTKSNTYVTQVRGARKKGGCYIATSVYGAYDCPEVWTLRRFRDDTLEKTWYGRAFISLYYAISPAMVKWFGETKWFQKLWKPQLDKMVKHLQNEGYSSSPYHDQ